MTMIGTNALEQILKLTQSMQELAEQALWDELVELEKQRQTIIDSTFPVEQPDQNEYHLLQKIIELNTQLESLCSVAKTDVKQQLVAFNSNKKAVNAYQQK